LLYCATAAEAASSAAVETVSIRRMGTSPHVATASKTQPITLSSNPKLPARRAGQ
jgi:hypothetical protein